MRDIADDLRRWLDDGRDFALATLYRTYRSAPRPAGTSMAVDTAGRVIGSLSGGCVEGAVHALAGEVLADGAARVAHYGLSDDDVAAVGLTCGGELDVVVVPLRAGRAADAPARRAIGRALAGLEADVPTALATLLPVDPAAPGAATRDEHPGEGDRELGAAMLAVDEAGTAGSLGAERLEDAVAADARGLLHSGRTDLIAYGADGRRRGDDLHVFVTSFAPRPRLVVFGAIDFARAVARLGAFLGFHVTVVDARAVFATTERFPEADEVVVDWPHRYLAAEHAAGRITPSTVLTVLTHDPKFDVPLLEVALHTPARYVGAMGSRRTHAARLADLRERGLTDAELARLHSPIGLDIGARTPEETAVSILAEVVATKWGGSGAALRAGDGPIHR